MSEDCTEYIPVGMSGTSYSVGTDLRSGLQGHSYDNKVPTCSGSIHTLAWPFGAGVAITPVLLEGRQQVGKVHMY